jgi:hypothetical protein
VESPDPAPGATVDGACPECGLGFRTSGVIGVARTEPESPDARDRRLRRLHAHRADAHRALAERTFRILGLDASWTGHRWLGGWGRHDGRVDSITLGHGDPHDAGAAIVRVESHAGSEPWTWRTTIQALASGLFHETGRWTPAHRTPFIADDGTASWEGIELSVDHRPTEFRLLRDGGHWVAAGGAAGQVLALTARAIRPSAVRLVEITDLEPYLANDASPR